MTDKRFKHLSNRLGMQFVCYDDKEILLGAFADADGVAHIVKLLNELHEEKEHWKEKAKTRLDNSIEAHKYWDCLEKAIEQVCSNDVQKNIWNKYDKLEKEIE